MCFGYLIITFISPRNDDTLTDIYNKKERTEVLKKDGNNDFLK